jgi:hypothetical protein
MKAVSMLRMWDRLNRLVDLGHFKRAIDSVADPDSGARAAPQMSGNQDVRSGACAIWHYGVGRQFELHNPTAHAEQSNAVAVDEGRLLGASRGYLNSWTFGTGFVCHDASLVGDSNDG